MRKQVIIYLTIVVIFLATYAVQGIIQGNNASDNTVRIGYFPNLTHAPALIAKNERIFEEALGEDATVEWKQFNDGPAAMEAMFAGEIDFSYIGPGPAISAYIQSGGDVGVVSGTTEGGAILISRKGSDINNLNDLTGKNVSVPKTGSTQEVALRGMMDTQGVSGIEIVQGKNSDVENLMNSGEIDAAFIVEPWGSLIEENGDAKVIIDNDESYKSGKYPTTVLISRQEYIDNNKELVQKLLKAQDEMIERINSDQEWAKKVVKEEMESLTKKELSEKLVDKAFTRMIFTDKIDAQDLKDMHDIQNKSGMIKEKDRLERILLNLD